MTYKCMIPAALPQNIGKYGKMQKQNKKNKNKSFTQLVPTAKK